VGRLGGKILHGGDERVRATESRKDCQEARQLQKSHTSALALQGHGSVEGGHFFLSGLPLDPPPPTGQIAHSELW